MGFPVVKVPVLSSTTVSTLRSCSNVAASLNKMPMDAAFPVATMMATGVARPNAQGQDITNTAMADVSAKEISLLISSQTSSTIAAMDMTTGTKTPDILSASRAMGALDPPACSTNRII